MLHKILASKIKEVVLHYVFQSIEMFSAITLSNKEMQQKFRKKRYKHAQQMTEYLTKTDRNMVLLNKILHFSVNR